MGKQASRLLQGAAIRNRRGVLAAASALIAGGLAKLAGPGPVEAGHNTNIAYDSQTTMHLDVTNTTAGSTRISSNISGTAAFVGLNNYPVGISRPDGILGRTAYTTSNCAGVAGACESASGGIGVMGTAKATNGTGVYGFAGSVVPSTLAPAGSGVYGSGPSYGVVGRSANGVGVHGQSTSGGSTQPGVVGSSSGGSGVYGTSGSNAGVFADSVTGIAMYAQSGQSYGVLARGGSTQASVYGDASASQGPGVLGVAASNNAGVFGVSAGNIGVYGTTTTGTGVFGHSSGTGAAGQFIGDVAITGSLTVTGSFPKSAGVPHPDGSVRRMYCLEAPESAFEDWGRVQLAGGRVTVKLDPDFAALVTADDYDVFVQAYGNCKGLYVAERTATSFEVRELDGGDSSVSLSYRVLARRKDLINLSKRLERVEIPRGLRRGGPRGLEADAARLPTIPPPAPLPKQPVLSDPAEQQVTPASDEPLR